MVVKMAKTMKSRRLRKRVRKTLGALFLASAIAVAAIPVDGLQASGEATAGLKVTVGEVESGIPTLKPDEKVYATGDGIFQFTYVSNDSNNPHAGTRNAVIVGYNPPNSLEGNTLEIPNEVEVYDLFTPNLGSGGRGYVAVGRAGNFLFWRKDTPVLDPVTGEPTYEQQEVTEKRLFYVLKDNTEVEVDKWNSSMGDRKPAMEAVLGEDGKPVYNDDGTPKEQQKVDKDGNPVWETFEKDVTIWKDDPTRPIVTSEYLPCYYSDKTEQGWGKYELKDFYTLKAAHKADGSIDTDAYKSYDSTDAGQFEQVGDDSSKQWIIHVAVAHIASQSVSIGADNSTTISDWITPENNATIKGVFQEKSGNVVNLKVGNNLVGIGNYAFAGCSSLQSITLGNGLRAIGNHAFDGCINIKDINTDLHSNLAGIGDHAFYNCQSLRSFNMPVSVTKLGDGTFENCYALAEISLHSPDEIKALSTIGDHVFMNCRSLTSLTIPSNVTSDQLELSMVYGCTSLQSLTLINENANFVEGKVPGDASTNFTFNDFKNMVPSTFYFEGVNRALTGDKPTGGLHKTANDNSIAFKYLGEDVYEIVIKDPDDPTKQAIYRVNSRNELTYCHLDDGMSTVVMPSTIGPYRITAISQNSFQNNCTLKKITIPSSVLTIAENAFKGCHRLEHVIFESPVQCQIGANAFKTQDVTLHQSTCDGTIGNDVKLTFTGDISYASGPFDYAMNPANNINVGSQERTYITYYSGWPTNLTVQYNPDTDKNELINYPTFADLESVTPVFTMANYPYITKEYEDAAKSAANKHKDPNNNPPMTEMREQL